MYTIFYNEIPILLTDSLSKDTDDNFYYLNSVCLNELASQLKSNKFTHVILYHSDIKVLWKIFKSHFKIEKAAGGLVKNQKGEMLFIYRFDKWDLPKGKIEKGESKNDAAIREVEEECGVEGLVIQKKLQKTYHIFQRNGSEILKITYWYAMETEFSGRLRPQLEEGITKVVFKDDEEVKKALENTYENIKLLF